MSEYKLTNIEELDNLDNQFSKKNKRKSGNLINRIGVNERIIFCYYSYVHGSIFNYFGKDIIYCILTDLKLISPYMDISSDVREIKLDEIRDLRVNTGLWASGINIIVNTGSLSGQLIGSEIDLTNRFGHATVFFDIKDKNFLQKIIGIIQKTKSNLQVRLQSPKINNNSSSKSNYVPITDQLAKLAELYKSGAITENEYKQAKGRVLSEDS